MGFDGYLSLGGVELINAERTQRYIRNQAPWLSPWVNGDYSDIHLALGDKPYESPLIDGAEWVHTDEGDFGGFPDLYTVPAFTASHRFYGLYPLGQFTGIGDSTETAQITEGALSGGQVGNARDGTRTIRVHGLLIGADELAAEAGLSWLRAAIRNTDCSMHSSACGTADLTYFLAPPEICDIWVKGFEGDGEHVGNVDPTNSPLIVRPNSTGAVPDLIWGSDFEFARADGQRVTWGAYSDDGTKIVEQHGPITIQRSNYASNPSFGVDAVGWDAVDATIIQVSTGGVDGTGYGRLVEDSPPVIRFNWAPDPAFVNPDMVTSGWRMIGATTGVTATGGPTARQGILTKGGTDATLAAELSTLGPQDGPIQSTISLWVAAHADPITAVVVDNLGVTVDTVTIHPAGAGRTFFQSTIGPNYVLRLTSVAAQIAIADLLVAEGTDITATFFSGDSPDTATTDYSWLGAPLLSASRFRNGALTPHSLTMLSPDTRYDTLADSFYLRSQVGAQVTAAIISLDDGSTLASLPISVPYAWTRYTLSTSFGRNTKLVISGTGTYNIDRVLIESGVTTAGSYFDGSSPSPDGYDTFWLAGANTSTSRRISVNVGKGASSDPDLDPNVTAQLLVDRESIALRAFLSVSAGSVTDVLFNFGIGAPVTADTQVDAITRRYHNVYSTQGVSILNRYPLNQGGAAIEVDFLLTAETPFAFGPTIQVTEDWEDLENFLYSDPVDTATNLVIDPSAERSIANAVIATNLVTNPSAETVVVGYTAIPGTSGSAGALSTTAATTFGTKVVRCIWTTASTAPGGGVSYDQAIVAGSKYSFGIGLVRSSITQLLQLQVEWRTASATISTVLGAAFAPVAGAAVAAPSILGIVAPATATIARVKVVSVAGTGYANWSIGSTLDIDGLMVNIGNTLFTYFDGATAAVGDYTYAWTGTANASTSTRTAPQLDWPWAGIGTDAIFRSSVTPKFGTYSARAHWQNTQTTFGQGISFGLPASGLPVVAGTTYSPSVWALSSKEQRLQLGIAWHTATGAAINVSLGVDTAVPAGIWTRVTTPNITAPATAAFAVLELVNMSTGVLWHGGDFLQADGMMLVTGVTVIPYFDGSTVAGIGPDGQNYTYAWTGTANASTSTRTIVVAATGSLVDPSLPTLPTSPVVPDVSDIAFPNQTDWHRFLVPIPKQDVALWGATVPTIILTSKTNEIRQVRLRFYPNPFGFAADKVDPLYYCGESIVSYIPPATELTVDGVSEHGFAAITGQDSQSADSILYGTGGYPMSWPEMSCGIDYVMSVDILPTLSTDDLDIGLEVTLRE